MSLEFFFKIVFSDPNNRLVKFLLSRKLEFFILKNKNMTTVRMYQSKDVFLVDY